VHLLLTRPPAASHSARGAQRPKLTPLAGQSRAATVAAADRLPGPPNHGEGEGRRRETDVQTGNETSFTNDTNTKRSNATDTEPTLPWGGRPASGRRAAPGSPGLDPAVRGNWTQEYTDRDPDRDRRQDKQQGPLQQPATDEGSETLVTSQF